MTHKAPFNAIVCYILIAPSWCPSYTNMKTLFLSPQWFIVCKINFNCLGMLRRLIPTTINITANKGIATYILKYICNSNLYILVSLKFALGLPSFRPIFHVYLTLYISSLIPLSMPWHNCLYLGLEAFLWFSATYANTDRCRIAFKFNTELSL